MRSSSAQRSSSAAATDVFHDRLLQLLLDAENRCIQTLHSCVDLDELPSELRGPVLVGRHGHAEGTSRSSRSDGPLLGNLQIIVGAAVRLVQLLEHKLLQATRDQEVVASRKWPPPPFTSLENGHDSAVDGGGAVPAAEVSASNVAECAAALFNEEQAHRTGLIAVLIQNVWRAAAKARGLEYGELNNEIEDDPTLDALARRPSGPPPPPRRDTVALPTIPIPPRQQQHHSVPVCALGESRHATPQRSGNVTFPDADVNGVSSEPLSAQRASPVRRFRDAAGCLHVVPPSSTRHRTTPTNDAGGPPPAPSRASSRAAIGFGMRHVDPDSRPPRTVADLAPLQRVASTAPSSVDVSCCSSGGDAFGASLDASLLDQLPDRSAQDTRAPSAKTKGIRVASEGCSVGSPSSVDVSAATSATVVVEGADGAAMRVRRPPRDVYFGFDLAECPEDALGELSPLAASGGHQWRGAVEYRILQVIAVEPRGPADAAGIFVGDILRAINGAPVSSHADVDRVVFGDLERRPAGTRCSMELLRGAELLRTEFVPERRPRPAATLVAGATPPVAATRSGSSARHSPGRVASPSPQRVAHGVPHAGIGPSATCVSDKGRNLSAAVAASGERDQSLVHQLRDALGSLRSTAPSARRLQPSSASPLPPPRAMEHYTPVAMVRAAGTLSPQRRDAPPVAQRSPRGAGGGGGGGGGGGRMSTWDRLHQGLAAGTATVDSKRRPSPASVRETAATSAGTSRRASPSPRPGSAAPTPTRRPLSRSSSRNASPSKPLWR